MFANRLAFVAVAVACIGAAAGGGYLAMRQNTVPASASAQTGEVAPAARPATAPGRPVQETEGVVGDAPKAAPALTPAKSAASPAPAAKKAAAARATAKLNQQPPALTSTWPTSAAQQPAPAPVMPPPVDVPPPAQRDNGADRLQQAPPPPPEPPQKTFEELTVSSGSVIGLQTENRITSETAHVEDRVDARVTRDVRVGDRVVIPAGSRVIGSVMQVERGGKVKDVAKLGVRFNTLVLADGTRVAINTDTILRTGDAPGNGSAAKIGGGAAVGTIIGAIFGGAKGAAIGAGAGAGAGGAAVAAGDRSMAVLQAGTPITVRLLAPITITAEK
jgi:hypothetical protein